jgi:hypothetical protein
MTVQAYTGPSEYSTNGVATVFTVPFYFVDDTHLKVMLVNLTTLVASELTLSTQYSVTGAGVSTGGSITTVATYASGYKIMIFKNVPYEQQTDYVEGDPFPAASHENALDLLCMQAQQLNEQYARSIRLPVQIQDVDSELPTPTAGRLLGINADGDGWEFYPIPTAVNSDFITPEAYLCVGDGVADDTAHLQEAIDAAKALGKMLYGQGIYRITGDITARMVGLDINKISVDSPDALVTIGGDANQTYTPPQNIAYIARTTEGAWAALTIYAKDQRVTWNSLTYVCESAHTSGASFLTDLAAGKWVAAGPTLRFRGSKNQYCWVNWCDYMQLYPDSNGNAAWILENVSIAYCTFNLGKIDKLEITTPPTTIGTLIQWANENRFNCQRIKIFVMGGTYAHNNNVFVGGNFERSGATITFNTGCYNKFYGIRFEVTSEVWVTGTDYVEGDRVITGNATYFCEETHTSGTFATDLAAGKWSLTAVITFAAGTYGNEVECAWASASNTMFSGALGTSLNLGSVSDSGVDNHVITLTPRRYKTQCIALASISDEFVNTLVAGQPNYGRVMSLQKVQTSSTNPIAESGYVHVRAGDILRWHFLDQTGGLDLPASDTFRTRVEFYDALLRPINASSTYILSLLGSFATASGNSLQSSSDQEKGALQITAAAITAGVRYVKAMVRGTATSVATRIEITHSSSNLNPMLAAPRSKPEPKVNIPVVTGVPTQGYCKAGAVAIKADKTLYLNTFDFETTLAAGYTSGTAVTIAAATGTADGDIIGINLDAGTTHWTTVASGGGTTSIGLTAGAASAAASGARVVFNRWV